MGDLLHSINALVAVIQLLSSSGSGGGTCMYLKCRLGWDERGCFLWAKGTRYGANLPTTVAHELATSQ